MKNKVKAARPAGTPAELDKSTKKGLGKTEDKVRDRLGAGDQLDESTKKGLGKTEDKIPDRLTVIRASILEVGAGDV